MLLNNAQGELTPQLGKSDPVVSLLKEYNIPVTRDNYLELAYLGEPPATLTAEQELELPESIRSTNGAA